MGYFKKCVTVFLSIAIVWGLTSCGSDAISDGVYSKSKKQEFPYISVESGEFSVYKGTDTVYKFSGSPDSDGEYVANLDDFVCIAISRKNKDSIKVDVRKRVSSVAASIDMVIYKSLKGTYSRQ